MRLRINRIKNRGFFLDADVTARQYPASAHNDTHPGKASRKAWLPMRSHFLRLCQSVMCMMNLVRTAPILAVVLGASHWGCSSKSHIEESFFADKGFVLEGEGKGITHVFTWKNRTGRVLGVKRINKSCTCTAASIDKNRLLPGEALNTTLFIRTASAGGIEQIGCTVEFDEPEAEKLVYGVKFTVVPRVRVEPPIVRLGDELFEREEVARLPVLITVCGRIDDDSLSSSLDNNMFCFAGRHVGVEIGSIQSRLDASLGPTIRCRSYAVELAFQRSSLERVNASKIPMTLLIGKHRAGFNIVHDFARQMQITPSIVNFGSVDPAAASVSRFGFIADSQNRTELGVRSDSDAVSAHIVPGAIGGVKIELRLDPSHASTRFGLGTGVVQVTSAGEVVADLPWVAIVRSPVGAMSENAKLKD